MTKTKTKISLKRKPSAAEVAPTRVAVSRTAEPRTSKEDRNSAPAGDSRKDRLKSVKTDRGEFRFKKGRVSDAE